MTKVMFSVCLSTEGGGVRVVPNFATRCPTVLAGRGGGWGVPEIFFSQIFFPKFFPEYSSIIFRGEGPEAKKFAIFLWPKMLLELGGAGGTPLTVTQEDCLVLLLYCTNC